MDIDRMRDFYGKRIDRLFEKSGLPVIVIFREEHDDDKHVCIDKQQLKLVLLTKLWVRYHANYYGVEPKPLPPPVPKSGLIFDNMPEGITKSGIVDDWDSYQISLSRHEKSVDNMAMVQAALRDQDGIIAFAVLKAYGDHEYEGFDTEQAMEIRSLPGGDLLEIKPRWSHDDGCYVGSG